MAVTSTSYGYKVTGDIDIETISTLPVTVKQFVYVPASNGNTVSMFDGIGVNLVGANPSFETWSSGDNAAPDNWTLNGAGASVAKESTIINDGLYSASLTRGGADTNLRATVLDTGNAAYGKRYISFKAQVYSTVANRGKLNIYDSTLLNISSSLHSGGSSWEELSLSGYISNTFDDTGKIYVYCYIVTGDTTVYFDKPECYIPNMVHTMTGATAGVDYKDNFGNKGSKFNKLYVGLKQSTDVLYIHVK
jgi:hypothetical protein